MEVRGFLAAFLVLGVFPAGCAVHRPGGRREPAAERDARRTPNAWLMGQRASAGPVPPRAIASALERAAAEGTLTLGPGSWVERGPYNVGGRLTALAVDPNDPSHVWIGAAAGGVFDSRDGGATWTPRFDAQSSLAIGSLAVHPTDSSTVYVGTGEDNGGGYSFDGDGVWKTTDGGASWTPMGLQDTRRIGRLAIDPSDPQRVFAAAGGNWFARDSNRGIYRSTDGGATWQQVLYVSDDTGGIDVVIDPSDTRRIYAAMWQRLSEGGSWYVGGVNGGVWQSVDGGTTWAKLAAGLPTGSVGRIGLAIAPSSPSTVYALIINDDGVYMNGIYRSVDSGATWTRTSTGGDAFAFSTYGYYFGRIRVDPSSPSTLYCLDAHLLKSTNGGKSLASIAGTVHPDWHDLVVDASGRMLAANDGGFVASTDGGVSWTATQNLPVSQLYDVAVSAQDPSRRIAGIQDNNVDRTATGGESDWTAVIAGDGLQVEVDPTDFNKVYGESQYGAIQRSTDGGATFAAATSGISGSERTNWNTPITLDPVVPTTLYTGTIRVYRSTDAAVSWSPVSPDLTDASLASSGAVWARRHRRDAGLDHLEDLIEHTVTVVAVSAVDHDIVWAGTDDGNVWVSSDSAATWTQVNPPGAPYWVTAIACDAFDASTAYLTVTGYRSGDKLPYVRETRDLGATWTDLSAGLPQLPANTVLADTAWRGRLYVGTDTGVEWSDDAGTTWTLLRNGMPSVPVLTLQKHEATNALFAATHARGIYSYDLGQLPNPADGDGDGVDNNADCALADPGSFAAPGEVASLTVNRAGATGSLAWASLAATAGSGTVYDVVCGDLATLLSAGTGGASALACGIAATSASDPSVPPAGSGVYYLVRGRNACGIGTWGFDSTGAPRSSPACP